MIYRFVCSPCLRAIRGALCAFSADIWPEPPRGGDVALPAGDLLENILKKLLHSSRQETDHVLNREINEVAASESEARVQFFIESNGLSKLLARYT